MNKGWIYFNIFNLMLCSFTLGAFTRTLFDTKNTVQLYEWIIVIACTIMYVFLIIKSIKK